MERLGVFEVVEHPYFGIGRIVADCGDTWEVRFSSGKQRHIMKSYELMKPEPVIYLFYNDDCFYSFNSYNALIDFLNNLVDALEDKGMDRKTSKRMIEKVFVCEEKSVLTLGKKEA